MTELLKNLEVPPGTTSRIDPDPAGFNGWIDLLSAGASRGAVLDGFLASQEFINLSEEFGITPF